MDNLDNKVYSKEVIEFTAVANEYCVFLEDLKEYKGLQILRFLQRLLPLLYSKTLALSAFDSLLEDEQEKFVTENDWQKIHDSLIVKLGEANDFLEVFDEQIEFSESAVGGSISENIADMYQDLKNYLISYSIGNLEIMNESLWSCLESFNLYWGQKLVNTLRAIHAALQTPERIGKQVDGDVADPENIKTDDWFISRRQSESKNDYDE